MFTRCPAVLPAGMATLATSTVFVAKIWLALLATLTKAKTVLVVVEASVMITEMESMIAPSLLLQSTSSRQPAAAGVLKLVDVVNAETSPIVANECNGRSINRGDLFVELEANGYSRLTANMQDLPCSLARALSPA